MVLRGQFPFRTTGARGRLPAKTAAVAALVLAHVVVGAYLVNASFTQKEMVTEEAPPPLISQILTLQKPVPAPKTPLPPKPVQSSVRPSPFTPLRPVDTLNVPTTPMPLQTIDLSPMGSATAPLPTIVDTPPTPSIITNPHWISQPDAAAMSRAYPELAARKGIGGAATLDCKINAAGRVATCDVVSESPSGYGFGNAALSLGKDFRMSPRLENGQAVGGGEVRIPIRFSPAPN